MNAHRVKKDRRKEYTISKRFDHYYQCHGDYSYYRDNRVYFDKRMRAAADEQVLEWKMFWNPEEHPDGTANSTDPNA